MYPTVALEPGATGAEVKKLQDWLVSQGYMTQAQVNTGYGTYGPQTTAAVLAYQKAKGIDYSSGPGYWGPRSIAAAAGTTSSSNTNTGGSSNTNTSTTTNTGSGGSTSYETSNGLPPGGSLTDKYGRTVPGHYNLATPENPNGVWIPIPTGSTNTNNTTNNNTSTNSNTNTNSGGGSNSLAGLPTGSLEPGASGAEVKKLQDWLVSRGYMTQAQVDTGYGTYGPQTTAAVTKLQKDLGVDNSSGPGFWGPRTMQAVTSFYGSSAATNTNNQQTTNSALDALLQNPNLSADQKAAVKNIYDAVSTNDAASADKLKAAMAAATEFSDPYFKAQIRLAVDALDRGMQAKDGDLSYSEGQLNRALTALRESTAASKDLLSFDHAQQLAALERKFETDLGNTRDNLAAAGFSSSSRRARAEDILNENKGSMVESSNKKFAYDTGNLDRTLNTNEASTQAQVENLRRLAAEGKLDLYRTTEGQVGSLNLPSYNGMSALGDVGGDIPRRQVQDALSFASNFVF